jgi:hypothetical protein
LVLLGYWFGRSRVVDVADLVGKELVQLGCIDTVVLLSLFCPGWSKTSCIGDSVQLTAFDKTAECGGPGLETGPLAWDVVKGEGNGVVGWFVILKYLVVVGCEVDRVSHSNFDDAILPRTHPEGDVRGGHGVDGAR